MDVVEMVDLFPVGPRFVIHYYCILSFSILSKGGKAHPPRPPFGQFPADNGGLKGWT